MAKFRLLFIFRFSMVVLTVCWCSSIYAAPEKIAVLELENKAELKATDVTYLSDAVRTEAVSLPKNRFSVVAKENIMAMLPPGTTLADCQGKCDVETGRNLGVDFLITGALGKFATQYTVTLKLLRVRDGFILGQEQSKAKTPNELETRVKEMSARVVGKLRGIGATIQVVQPNLSLQRSTKSGNRVPGRLVKVRFISKPKGAKLRIREKEYVTPQILQLEPGAEYTVEATMPKYKSVRRLIQVDPRTVDSTQEILIELQKNFGDLSLTLTPENAQVEVDGQNRGRGTRGSLFVEKLSPGQHMLEVAARGYFSRKEQFVIKVGDVLEKTIKLEAKTGLLDVRAQAQNGSSLELAIYVDGQKLSDKTPTTIQLTVGRHRIDVGRRKRTSKTVLIRHNETTKHVFRVKNDGRSLSKHERRRLALQDKRRRRKAAKTKRRPAPASTARVASEKRGTNWLAIAGTALVLGGGISTAVGVVKLVTAASDEDVVAAAKETNALNALNQAEASARINDIQDRKNVGATAIGVGLGGMVIGAILIGTSMGKEASKTAWRPGLYSTGDGAILSFTGGF